jgi:threonine aldolase
VPAPDGRIDLRSDTVTRPTEAMRAAMSRADVGDDVYAEDPTVRALEERVAAMLGHEAALFVPSGTMGNQVAIQLLVGPGDELLCDGEAHIVTYEGGGAAQYGGIQTRTVFAPRGILDSATVEPQLREGFFTVPTRAVAVEQTNNRGMGAVYPLEVLQGLRTLTSERGIALHCDGARIWNAAVASGTALDTYGPLFDTLSVCFSKGLGAPVGSAVVGPAEAMGRARTIRRRLGGGMRQAGILAAAALYALDQHVDRLADDHARARRLAERCAEAAPQIVSPSQVETNIVAIDLTAHPLSAAELVSAAAAEGVLLGQLGPRRARALTHLDVTDDDVAKAGDVLARLLSA